MNTQPHPVAPEILLRHTGWMRNLARGLVRDDAQADDVVQEAMVVALRSPGRDRQALPAWLATVVRNCARQLWRGESRRTARERTSARHGSVSSTADAVSRAEEHALVAQSVIALQEPYRTSIVLRFLEELPPREVAARTGVPVETARTRIRRGLDRLRRHLDTAHGGDGKAWKAALLPLCVPRLVPASGTGTSIGVAGAKLFGGVLAMTTTTTMITAGVALVAGLAAGWFLQHSGDSAATDGGATVEAAAAQDADPEGGTADGTAVSRRQTAQIAKLREQLQAARAENDVLLERLGTDALPPDHAAVPAEAETAAEAASFAFAEFGALAEVDWKEVGEHTRALIRLFTEVAEARARGERPSPEVIGALQKHHGAYLAATLAAAEELPGALDGSAYTHPAFLVNSISATLAALELPLTAEQSRELHAIATKFCEADQARIARYHSETLRYEKIYEEADLRSRFLDEAIAKLTDEQRGALSPTAVRGTLQFDLFGDGRMWAQEIEPIPFARGDVEAFATGALSALDAHMRLDAASRSVAIEIVNEWARALPGAMTQPAAEVSVAKTREASAHTLALLRRLVDELRLEGASLEAARDWEDVILPRPASR